MQPELSCHAPLPHLSRVPQDYPRTMDLVCSAGPYHRIVYRMGTVVNRSGMNQASVPRLAVRQAYCLEFRHISLASGYQQEVRMWTTTQPSTAESWSCTEASQGHSA